MTIRADLPLAERLRAIEEETCGVAAQCGLDSWQRTFLTDVKHRLDHGEVSLLSSKQADTLTEIENLVFGPEARDEQTRSLF